MTDTELLIAAIAASGESNQGFARRVLGVDGSAVRKVLRGDRPLNASERILCTAVVADPNVTPMLMAAADSIASG